MNDQPWLKSYPAGVRLGRAHRAVSRARHSCPVGAALRPASRPAVHGSAPAYRRQRGMRLAQRLGLGQKPDNPAVRRADRGRACWSRGSRPGFSSHRSVCWSSYDISNGCAPSRPRPIAPPGIVRSRLNPFAASFLASYVCDEGAGLAAHGVEQKARRAKPPQVLSLPAARRSPLAARRSSPLFFLVRGVLRALAGSRRRDLGIDGFCLFDLDRFQPSGGQLQSVSLSVHVVAPPHVRARLGLDLLD